MEQGQPDPAQLRDRQIALNAKVIDRIRSDPKFARALKEDPERAFRDAGLESEVHEIEGLVPKGTEEVQGQMLMSQYYRCYLWTFAWQCWWQ